jgi:UDP-N-acetylmuramoyl-L-alanyl-D-glutamate--2,6-diaminopimelate ligase
VDILSKKQKKILLFQLAPVISYTHTMITKIIPQQIKNLKHYFVAMHYCRKYKNPSKKMTVIGVTGSDGKTTTSNIIYTILKDAGLKAGVISTISVKTDKQEFPLDFHVTNPAPKDLQKILHTMLNEGVEYVVLETTSHGLDQFRVAGIKYDFAVFTNVTHEHLDYHKTYENYLKTKAKLIRYTSKEGTIVLNQDDQSFKYLNDLATALDKKVITYGFSKSANIQAEEFVKEKKKFMDFTVKVGEKFATLTTNLRGRYNISNILAAISVANEFQIPIEKVSKSLINLPQLEGRWEIIQEKPFEVVVDFAHTPNSLENVLKRGDQSKNKNGKLIVVFGCAGKRDKSKRPKMGAIAAKYANRIILTAEDPRGESIEKINNQIINGIKETPYERDLEYISIPDRETAIRDAIKKAQKGDLVLITGKGHEKSMNLDGKKELPWNEKEIVKKILN